MHKSNTHTQAPDCTKEGLYKFSKSVIDAYFDEEVYLAVVFGSYAKGSEYVDQDSDFDLLVISDKKIPPMRSVLKVDDKIVDFHTLDRATLVYLLKVAPQVDVFYAEIIRTGVCIMGSAEVFTQWVALAETARTRVVTASNPSGQRARITNLLKDLEWSKSDLERYSTASKTLLATLQLLSLLSGNLPVLLRRPADNVSPIYQHFLPNLIAGFQICAASKDCTGLCKAVDDVLASIGGRLDFGYKVPLPYNISQ